MIPAQLMSLAVPFAIIPHDYRNVSQACPCTSQHALTHPDTSRPLPPSPNPVCTCPKSQNDDTLPSLLHHLPGHHAPHQSLRHHVHAVGRGPRFSKLEEQSTVYPDAQGGSFAPIPYSVGEGGGVLRIYIDTSRTESRLQTTDARTPHLPSQSTHVQAFRPFLPHLYDRRHQAPHGPSQARQARSLPSPRSRARTSDGLCRVIRGFFLPQVVDRDLVGGLLLDHVVQESVYKGDGGFVPWVVALA
ncbi:hypothetical protein PAXRUDRAFT_756687 [Paxillus rubicundulus Ve08.2h10]|uniref:Uncharacterized protein n=1 Tax=Paxillus rubicundulus Ve08.2h10 TaxID=930991 RepID=A0A0D0DBN1_9AGAM|nr:hypothetical protein PAXRUDRAFT_756687 [Paxillus rubicundulus Ve08.2h10]